MRLSIPVTALLLALASCVAPSRQAPPPPPQQALSVPAPPAPPPKAHWRDRPVRDRKSVVSGKSVSVRVDIGGRRILKKKKYLSVLIRTNVIHTRVILTNKKHHTSKKNR